MNQTAIAVIEASLAGETSQLEASVFATEAPAEIVRLLEGVEGGENQFDPPNRVTAR
jgi:hypothetical protein